MKRISGLHFRRWGDGQHGIFPLLLILLLGCYAGLATASSDPFSGQHQHRDDTQTAVASTSGKTASASGSLLEGISRWQMVLRQKIATAVRDFKNDGRFLPLLPLFGLVLLYGIVHAAGPGHGKAVAMSYALARGRSYSADLILGALISLTHAGSAVLLVFVLRVVLHKSIGGDMERVTRITELASSALIICIGCVILGTSIAAVVLTRPDPEDDEKCQCGRLMSNPLMAALSIGMVPCPGVIVILLFCMSLDQFLLGLLLAFTVSVGMAITITLSVWLIQAGRQVTLQLSARQTGALKLIERLLRILAGLALIALGGMSFAGKL